MNLMQQNSNISVLEPGRDSQNTGSALLSTDSSPWSGSSRQCALLLEDETMLTPEDRAARRKESKRKYYLKHRTENRLKARQYYAEHAEAKKEYGRRYAKENKVHLKPAVIERKRRWYKDNLEHCKVKRKKYYDMHREEMIQKSMEWQRNSPTRKEYMSNYNKNRDRSGEPERVAQSAVYNAVKFGKLIKPCDCEMCGRMSTKLHGHHWSYEKEHRLHVSWLCTKCHGLTRRVCS